MSRVLIEGLEDRRMLSAVTPGAIFPVGTLVPWNTAPIMGPYVPPVISVPVTPTTGSIQPPIIATVAKYGTSSVQLYFTMYTNGLKARTFEVTFLNQYGGRTTRTIINQAGTSINQNAVLTAPSPGFRYTVTMVAVTADGRKSVASMSKTLQL